MAASMLALPLASPAFEQAAEKSDEGREASGRRGMRFWWILLDVPPSFTLAGIRARRLFALPPNLGLRGSRVFCLAQVRKHHGVDSP